MSDAGDPQRPRDATVVESSTLSQHPAELSAKHAPEHPAELPAEHPAAPPRRRVALVALILVVAVVLGTAFRVDSMRHKHSLHVDEEWSYVTAAGHLSDWGTAGGAGLEGRWVPAAQWKAMAGPGKTFDFGQIISGLGNHDVHPPLYFSALHVWTLIFGVKFWTGPLLNLLIDLLVGAALFGLARRLLHDPVAAALTVLIWSVSPVVRMTSSMARMYALEALFSVLLVWLLLQVTDRQRAPLRPRLTAALFALATAGGMLTQYQFLLIIAGAALYVVVVLGRFDRRRCGWALLAMAAGLVLSWLVEPKMFAQFQRQSAKHLPTFSLVLLRNKVNGTVETVFGFFGLNKTWLKKAIDRPAHLWGLVPGHHVSSLVLLAFLLCVAAALALALPRSRRWLVRRDWTGGLALLFLAWVGGTIVVQNLLFLSQPTILSARYLAVAWPFLAFLPVIVSRALLPRRPYLIAAVVCLAVMVPLSLAPVNIATSSGPLPTLTGAQRAVVDCPIPGVLPLVVWYLPDHALVYADSSARLRARPAAWLDQLRGGDFFVHRANGKPDALPQLRGKFTIMKMPPPFRVDVYRVAPASGG